MITDSTDTAIPRLQVSKESKAPRPKAGAKSGGRGKGAVVPGSGSAVSAADSGTYAEMLSQVRPQAGMLSACEDVGLSNQSSERVSRERRGNLRYKEEKTTVCRPITCNENMATPLTIISTNIHQKQECVVLRGSHSLSFPGP